MDHPLPPSTPELPPTSPIPVSKPRKPWLLIGLSVSLAVVSVAAAGVGGYWLGQRSVPVVPIEKQASVPSTTSPSPDSLDVLPELAHEDALYAQMPNRSQRNLTNRNLQFSVPFNWHFLECQGTDLALFFDSRLAMDTKQECNFDPGGQVQILMTDNYGQQPGEQATLHQQPQVTVSGFTGYRTKIEAFRGTEPTVEVLDRVVVELPAGYGHHYLVITKLTGASAEADGVFEDVLTSLKVTPVQ